jgi:acyl-CoA thioesterase
LNGDAFSQWLGIEILEVSEGYCKLQMKIRKQMTNGFAIAHGGIAYSLADTALAFAANTHGIQSLSVNNAISYSKKVIEGDLLIASVKEISLSDKNGLYTIKLTNQKSEEIAHFKGTVCRTRKEWFSNK